MKKATKEKKPVNVAQRVEILLKDGVDKPGKWMPLKAYKPNLADCVGGDAWSAEWEKLSKHHDEETTFLLDVIREMREQILSMDEQLDRKFGPKVDA